jgi:hypothetical protein
MCDALIMDIMPPDDIAQHMYKLIHLKDYYILGSNTMQSGRSSLMFQSTAGGLSPDYTASHPRR